MLFPRHQVILSHLLEKTSTQRKTLGKVCQSLYFQLDLLFPNLFSRCLDMFHCFRSLRVLWDDKVDIIPINCSPRRGAQGQLSTGTGGDWMFCFGKTALVRGEGGWPRNLITWPNSGSRQPSSQQPRDPVDAAQNLPRGRGRWEKGPQAVSPLAGETGRKGWK